MAERCPGSVCPPDLPLFDEAGNVIPGTGAVDAAAGPHGRLTSTARR